MKHRVIDLTTPAKRETYRAALEQMLSQRGRLRAAATRYPLFINIENQRYVSVTADEIDELIVAIELELSARC